MIPLCILDVDHYSVPDGLLGPSQAPARRRWMDDALGEAKVAGVLAVVLKATQGTTFVDQTHDDWAEAVVASGLLGPGHYHFGTSAPVEQQLAHFLAVLGIKACRQPGRPGFLALDIEPNELAPHDTMAPAQAVAWAEQFEIAVGEPGWSYGFAADLCGRVAPVLLADGQRPPPALQRTRLWLSEVCGGTAPRRWPDLIWPTWAAWQAVTTDATPPGVAGVIKGIGRVDLSSWSGTREGLEASFAPRP